MRFFMPITYLPPTSHLQSYNLPTYQPAHSPTWIYYHYLPTYPHTYLHTFIMYLHIHLLTYIYTYYLHTHLLINLPTHHLPISYNLPIFILHSLVVMCQNKHMKWKNWQMLNTFQWCDPLLNIWFIIGVVKSSTPNIITYVHA